MMATEDLLEILKAQMEQQRQQIEQQRLQMEQQLIQMKQQNDQNSAQMTVITELLGKVGGNLTSSTSNYAPQPLPAFTPYDDIETADPNGMPMASFCEIEPEELESSESSDEHEMLSPETSCEGDEKLVLRKSYHMGPVKERLIENIRNRQKSFSARKKTLLNTARSIAIITNALVSVRITSESGRTYVYESRGTEEEITQRKRFEQHTALHGTYVKPTNSSYQNVSGQYQLFLPKISSAKTSTEIYCATPTTSKHCKPASKQYSMTTGQTKGVKRKIVPQRHCSSPGEMNGNDSTQHTSRVKSSRYGTRKSAWICCSADGCSVWSGAKRMQRESGKAEFRCTEHS